MAVEAGFAVFYHCTVPQWLFWTERRTDYLFLIWVMLKWAKMVDESLMTFLLHQKADPIIYLPKHQRISDPSYSFPPKNLSQHSTYAALFPD